MLTKYTMRLCLLINFIVGSENQDEVSSKKDVSLFYDSLKCDSTLFQEDSTSKSRIRTLSGMDKCDGRESCSNPIDNQRISTLSSVSQDYDQASSLNSIQPATRKSQLIENKSEISYNKNFDQIEGRYEIIEGFSFEESKNEDQERINASRYNASCDRVIHGSKLLFDSISKSLFSDLNELYTENCNLRSINTNQDLPSNIMPCQRDEDSSDFLSIDFLLKISDKKELVSNIRSFISKILENPSLFLPENPSYEQTAMIWQIFLEYADINGCKVIEGKKKYDIEIVSKDEYGCIPGDFNIIKKIKIKSNSFGGSQSNEKISIIKAFLCSLKVFNLSIEYEWIENDKDLQSLLSPQIFLNTLDISGCKLDSIMFKTLADNIIYFQDSLKSLKIFLSCELQSNEMMEAITNFSFLAKLDIRGTEQNELFFISVMSKCKNLKSLNIVCSELTKYAITKKIPLRILKIKGCKQSMIFLRNLLYYGEYLRSLEVSLQEASMEDTNNFNFKLRECDSLIINGDIQCKFFIRKLISIFPNIKKLKFKAKSFDLGIGNLLKILRHLTELEIGGQKQDEEFLLSILEYNKQLSSLVMNVEGLTFETVSQLNICPNLKNLSILGSFQTSVFLESLLELSEYLCKLQIKIDKPLRSLKCHKNSNLEYLKISGINQTDSFIDAISKEDPRIRCINIKISELNQESTLKLMNINYFGTLELVMPKSCYKNLKETLTDTSSMYVRVFPQEEESSDMF